MSGGKSQYLETKLLDHVLGATLYVPPVSVFVALFTVTPNEDGTGGTEVAGTAYARAAVLNNVVNWPNAAAGDPSVKSNGTAVSFLPAGSDWAPPATPVVAFAIFDLIAAGNCLYWGELIIAGSEVAFTALQTGSPTLVAPGHLFNNNDTVRLSTLHNEGLPGGLADRTTYFIKNKTVDTFELSLTAGGAAIVITADGSGKVGKLQAKIVQTGDTLSFAVGALSIAED